MIRWLCMNLTAQPKKDYVDSHLFVTEVISFEMVLPKKDSGHTHFII
jgi:hypothetical protein